MPTTVIEAQKRIPGGKNVNRRLRKSGIIPAVMYGPGKQPTVVSVDPQVIRGILHSDAGRNAIFSVSVDGSEQDNAMVKDYQLDPVQGNLIHVDLIQIAMDQQLTLEISIELVGEAEGVKIGGGVMDFVTRSIEVECLPKDIPESIKVDVSKLQINDYIRVRNIEIDPNVKIISDAEVVVVTIIPPAKEETKAEGETPDTGEPEVIKKGKPSEEGEKA